LAYDASFAGDVRVALGDVDGNGFGDIITAPGPGGGPLVKVYKYFFGDLTLLARSVIACITAPASHPGH